MSRIAECDLAVCSLDYFVVPVRELSGQIRGCTSARTIAIRPRSFALIVSGASRKRLARWARGVLWVLG